MLWPAIYIANTMAQANVLAFVVGLASGDPARLMRGVWGVLDFWDPEVALAFYLTWWYIALRHVRDQMALAVEGRS